MFVNCTCCLTAECLVQEFLNVVMYVWYCNIHPTRCNVSQFIFLETALHVSGGITVHHQESKQLYLQHLVFFTPLLLSVAIVEELELV